MTACGLWLSNKRYATKAGTRAMINTSPEPFSNWTASIAEDIAVFAGLWAALNHPTVFTVMLVLFLIFAAWMLPKLFRAIAALGRKISGAFKPKPA